MLNSQHITKLIALALEEDIPSGDVTTESIGGLPMERTAEIIAKEQCVVAGLPVVSEVALQVSTEIKVKALVSEGAEVERGEAIASIRGPLEQILIFERTALNFLQHLSGIASHARRLVEQASGLTLLDTRKTLPGYRELEKYAVRVGGAMNHRMSLSDQVLIKDNHVDGSGKTTAELVALSKENRPDGILVEVEVRTFEELRAVVAAKPDIILLDNMSGEELRRSVQLISQTDPKIIIEVSGNITEARFDELRPLGEIRASMGALTYGARRVDLSLLIAKETVG